MIHMKGIQNMSQLLRKDGTKNANGEKIEIQFEGRIVQVYEMIGKQDLSLAKRRQKVSKE